MAATHGQSFVLERIALVGNDELQITGGWHGIDGADLRLAELVIERAEGTTHMNPVAGSVTGDVQHWSARFPIGDPDVVRLQLRVGDALTVELPWSGRVRRRFGRVKLPVQVAGDAHPHLGTPERGLPADENDLVSAHVALLAVREELAAMSDELATARTEAARAMEDAARARAAREQDAARSQAALASLRAVAEDAVKQSQAKLEALVAEREQLVGERDQAIADYAELRDRLEVAEEAHAQLAERSRSELESAHAQVAALEQELAAEKDRHSVLAVALSAARADSLRLADRETELERLASDLGDARTQWERAEKQTARLRSRLSEAREGAQEADAELRRLAAALRDNDEGLKAERARAAHAVKAAERAAREAMAFERQRDVARNQLGRVAEAAQQSDALAARVPGLEQELEQARRALGGANAELEQLKVRLQAVHAALQNGG